eukprot:9359998-Pyramimonas_sp.AAC.1
MRSPLAPVMSQVDMLALFGLALLTSRMAPRSTVRSHGAQASGPVGGSLKTLRGSEESSFSPSSAT